MAKPQLAAAEAPEERLPVPVQQTGTSVIPADLLAEIQKYEGAGTSGAPEDNVIPFLVILQDMSPEVKKRDPKYIEGAEPGCLLNKATRRLWMPDEECIIVPCAFQKVIVEWRPRDSGTTGIEARHEITEPTVEDTMMKIGARGIREDSGRVRWTSQAGNDLIETRYHFVLTVAADGTVEEGVIPFSSSGHKSAKAWMKLQRAVYPGTKFIPPAWTRQYNAKRIPMKNSSGSWFGFDMQPRGLVENPEIRALGAMLFESVKAKTVRMDEDDGLHNEESVAPSGVSNRTAASRTAPDKPGVDDNIPF